MADFDFGLFWTALINIGAGETKERDSLYKTVSEQLVGCDCSQKLIDSTPSQKLADSFNSPIFGWTGRVDHLRGFSKRAYCFVRDVLALKCSEICLVRLLREDGGAKGFLAYATIVGLFKGDKIRRALSLEAKEQFLLTARKALAWWKEQMEKASAPNLMIGSCSPYFGILALCGEEQDIDRLSAFSEILKGFSREQFLICERALVRLRKRMETED